MLKEFNYLVGKRKMLDELGRIDGTCRGVNCSMCPLAYSNNGFSLDCGVFEVEHPYKATQKVHDWLIVNDRCKSYKEIRSIEMKLKFRTGLPEESSDYVVILKSNSVMTLSYSAKHKEWNTYDNHCTEEVQKYSINKELVMCWIPKKELVDYALQKCNR